MLVNGKTEVLHNSTQTSHCQNVVMSQPVLHPLGNSLKSSLLFLHIFHIQSDSRVAFFCCDYHEIAPKFSGFAAILQRPHHFA